MVYGNREKFLMHPIIETYNARNGNMYQNETAMELQWSRQTASMCALVKKAIYILIEMINHSTATEKEV